MPHATDTLAILGGPKAVPDDLLQPWPPIGEIDRRYVMASLESDAHTFGPNCVKLQDEFAAWNGNRRCIATNSGTAALHMAVAAVGCGAGDHVLVTAYTWSSSATCALHHNAIPVFVDIDWETMNIDVTKIEAAITPQTRAIIVVHLHGLAVNMDVVLDIARRHKLMVIEDACQSHGATFKGRKVGTFGHCAAFSLNQNKCLCGGEGGLFVTDDDDLHLKALQIWSFGETATPAQSRDYHAYALGWMYRNDDLGAAFARAQLTKLDGYIARQRENAAALFAELEGAPGLILPTEPQGHMHNWYNATLRIDPTAWGYDGPPVALRDKLLKAMNAEGARAMVWQRFILPDMTVFKARNAYGQGVPWSLPQAGQVDYDPAKFPVAQRHCDTHFCLGSPLRAPNGRDAARAVARAIRKVLEQADVLINATPARE